MRSVSIISTWWPSMRALRCCTNSAPSQCPSACANAPWPGCRCPFVAVLDGLHASTTAWRMNPLSVWTAERQFNLHSAPTTERRLSSTGSFTHRTRGRISSFVAVGAPRPPRKRLSALCKAFHSDPLLTLAASRCRRSAKSPARVSNGAFAAFSSSIVWARRPSLLTGLASSISCHAALSAPNAQSLGGETACPRCASGRRRVACGTPACRQ